MDAAASAKRLGVPFAIHSDAPVTTLVVKDRVTGHNPVSVLYGQNFYYKRLQAVPLEVGEPPEPE